MKTFSNFLREYLPDMQKAVEETLDIKLGDISIKPYVPEYLNDIINEDYKPVFSKKVDRLLLVPFQYLDEFSLAACVRDMTIYPTNCPWLIFANQNDMTFMGLHELGHVAHNVLVKNKKHMRDISEGFADFAAIESMKKMGLDYPSPLMWGQKYLKKFNKLMKQQDYEGISGAKKFVIDETSP